jgi:hypothetical protein
MVRKLVTVAFRCAGSPHKQPPEPGFNDQLWATKQQMSIGAQRWPTKNMRRARPCLPKSAL